MPTVGSSDDRKAGWRLAKTTEDILALLQPAPDFTMLAVRRTGAEHRTPAIRVVLERTSSSSTIGDPSRSPQRNVAISSKIVVACRVTPPEFPIRDDVILRRLPAPSLHWHCMTWGALSKF